jgi:hypothetical protein
MAEQKKRNCLNNQLYDKLEADLVLLFTDPNLEAKYLVRGKKIFKRSMEFLFDPSLGNRKVLEYDAREEILYTQVALTTDRATVRRHVTESIGTITDAHAEGITSHSRDLTLTVDIQNTGALTADYIVSVTDCNFEIEKAYPSQARTIEPNIIDTFYFDIYTNQGLDTQNYCIVSLRSPSGRKYDDQIVFFDTVPELRDLQAPCWMYPPDAICRFE